jgi:hypothetical protein
MKESPGNGDEGRLVRESIMRIMMGTMKQPPGYGDEEELGEGKGQIFWS